jgi:2-dehydro-3-deoxyphosphooctonate aldolase (KDO 8-P synthase)
MTYAFQEKINPKSIDISGISFSNAESIKLIAGPCSLESRDMAMTIAEHLSGVSHRLGIPFIFKGSFDKANRTSLSKRGMGWDQALRIFEEVKETFSCPVLTDVHLPTQCRDVASVADVLQIPAFLCRQTDLIQSAAATGKPLHIKKGQFLSPQEMQQVAKKAEASGAQSILLCERGFSFGYNMLISDMRGIPIMAASGWPVIFDATHSVQRPGGMGGTSGGDRHMVETLARAAVGVGVSGLFMETHPKPEEALSDGPNMVPLDQIEGMLQTLIAIDQCTKIKPYQAFSAHSF